MRPVSSWYTDCGGPLFMPRLPAKETRLTRGRYGAGKTDSSFPPKGTVVGRNTPAKPSCCGRASGTLTTPSEVNPDGDTGMKGTASLNTTRPAPSVTRNTGAYP